VLTLSLDYGIVSTMKSIYHFSTFQKRKTIVPACHSHILTTHNMLQCLHQISFERHQSLYSKLSRNMVSYALYTSTKLFLIPKCRQCHFVAYEWLWTSLGDKGRQFFIHWFLRQFVSLVVHHIQSRSFSFCKNELCKKIKWPCSIIKFFQM
jgi:hypothetical protein